MGEWKGSNSDTPKVITAKISAEYTATQQVFTGECVFYGIIVKTDGANDITVNIFDNTAASGTRLIPTDTIIAGTKNIDSIGYPLPIKCDNGIHVTVAGAGTERFMVVYDDGA